MWFRRLYEGLGKRRRSGMSYHDAMRKLAWDDGYGEECPDCGELTDDCECVDDGFDAHDDRDAHDADESDGYDDSDEGRLRQKITDAMPEGDPEAYMSSGQELLDELLANPDRTKLGLILDKEIEELNALLGDTSDIDLEGLKDAALAAFDTAAEKSGPSRGAVMAALAAIKSAAGRALGALGLG